MYFKPKNRLGSEPESTMSYTGSLKIYLPRSESDRTRTGSEPNFYITRMELILINLKNQNPNR